MLSKSKADADLLTCCKCDFVFDSDPIQLTCGHFICSLCSSKLKLHVYMHCGSLKLLSSSRTDFNSKGVLLRRLKRTLNEQRLRKFCLFNEKFCNSLFESSNTITNDAELFRLIRLHFTCPICKLLFNGSSRLPLLLPCSHSICTECFDSVFKELSDCPECNKSVRYSDSIRAQCDYLIFNLLSSVDSILGKMQSLQLSETEQFFANWSLRVQNKHEEVLNETLHDLEQRVLNFASNEQRLQRELNNCRLELLKKAESMLKMSMNIIIGQKSAETKTALAVFRESQLELASSGLLGRLRFAEQSIISRIKYLHLNKSQVFKCDFLVENDEKENSKIKERVDLAMNDWSQSRFKHEHFLVISLTRIFFILSPGMHYYLLKMVNPLSNKLIMRKKINKEFRLIYCQTNCTDRIAILFEKDYNKEYVVELYELASLDFVRSRNFPFYLDKIHLNENQLLIWSPTGPPFIKLFDLNLNPLREINKDCDLFELFYSLPIQTDNYFVFNNQTQIALVKCFNLRVHKLINLDAYLDENDCVFESKRKERTFIWHCESEYFNVKSVQNKFLLVSTSSKVLLFDLNSAQLLAKNHMYKLNTNNNWFVPNRFYVGNDLSLAFFDLSTLSLTHF